MTGTRPTVTKAKARSVARRIESFHQQFGDGHLYLACHAAFPIALTPDLLYSLWANFQKDSQGNMVEIPWIAVADLILSNLCKEVGNELYEMEQVLRDELLNQLQQDSRFGLERVRELADFIMAYIERDLEHPDWDTRILAETQRWRAMAYQEPTKAAHAIAFYFSQLDFQDKGEWLRMAALLETLSQPLAEFQSLLIYSQAMAVFARGDVQKAMEQMKQAVDANNQINVSGINLPVPLAMEPPSVETSAETETQVERSTRLRWLIAAGLGSIVAVILFVGLQQENQNSIEQSSSEVTTSPTPTPQARSLVPTPQPSSVGSTPRPSTSISTSPRQQSPVQTNSPSSLPPQEPSQSNENTSPSPNATPSQNNSSTSQESVTPGENPTNVPQTATVEEDPQSLSQRPVTDPNNPGSNPGVLAPPVTADQIMQITPDAPLEQVRQLVPYLNQAMAEFGINTRLRQAHFLAQVGFESNHFTAPLEMSDASSEIYEGRRDLGNTQPGDGVRFKSRGLIQVAGRVNYAAIGKDLGVDLISDPARLADPDLAARSAAWYWSIHNLNSLADKDNVRNITRLVNGGLNGLDERTQLLQRAKKALGI